MPCTDAAAGPGSRGADGAAARVGLRFVAVVPAVKPTRTGRCVTRPGLVATATEVRRVG